MDVELHPPHHTRACTHPMSFLVDQLFPPFFLYFIVKLWWRCPADHRETTDAVPPPFTPARIRHGQRSLTIGITLKNLDQLFLSSSIILLSSSCIIPTRHYLNEIIAVKLFIHPTNNTKPKEVGRRRRLRLLVCYWRALPCGTDMFRFDSVHFRRIYRTHLFSSFFFNFLSVCLLQPVLHHSISKTETQIINQR